MGAKSSQIAAVVYPKGCIVHCGIQLLNPIGYNEYSSLHSLYPIGYKKAETAGAQGRERTEVMRIASQIRKLRERAGLTQEELAKRAGVGLRFLRELEQGKRNPSVQKVNQVLALFGHHLEAVKDRGDVSQS